MDKILTRFFNHDIDFERVEKFNEKYFLVSNSKTEVLKYFDTKFLDTIAKYNEILLTTMVDKCLFPLTMNYKTIKLE